MRKIFSILVILGLVLGMVTMTAPVAAAPYDAVVALNPAAACEGVTTTYCINFTIYATATAGIDTFTVNFPSGTVLPTDWTSKIAVEQFTPVAVAATTVLKADVTSAGSSVTFTVPFTISASGANPAAIRVCVAGVKNPPAAKDLTLTVTHETCCDVYGPWTSQKYTINPKCSTYKALMDFSPTYPGLSPSFIPPFQACGQNDTPPAYVPPGVTWFDTTHNITMDAWFSGFNLTLKYDTLGCAPCCTNPEFYFVLKSAPSTTAKATLSVNGTWFTLTTATPGTTDTGSLGVIVLEAGSIIVYPSFIHFDTVGDYEICFYLECETTGECGAQGSELKELGCFPFEVHQWKNAFPIPLYRKFNLISLPFVPFETDLGYVLSALPTPADVLGTWYFTGGLEGTWPAVTTMEDGKAYWLKVKYTTATAGDYYGQLWVWGTDRPGNPPVPPGPYPVLEGWNMVGFTSLVTLTTDFYLQAMGPNFFGVYGWNKIYGWLPATQQFYLVPQKVGNLTPGQGYWIEFSWAGVI